MPQSVKTTLVLKPTRLGYTWRGFSGTPSSRLPFSPAWTEMSKTEILGSVVPGIRGSGTAEIRSYKPVYARTVLLLGTRRTVSPRSQPARVQKPSAGTLRSTPHTTTIVTRRVSTVLCLTAVEMVTALELKMSVRRETGTRQSGTPRFSGLL